ncbi:Hypothetical_protein [Hexamita inflata]|uniref:Hypothetical_protein n=1 Tax=Hexamita inflata TaxID=28002 RepID=A0AA86VF31_9EUKA|nr:Hypothetical protein HINF_LOCUS52473 [Hexamita inflata]
MIKQQSIFTLGINYLIVQTIIIVCNRLKYQYVLETQNILTKISVAADTLVARFIPTINNFKNSKSYKHSFRGQQSQFKCKTYSDYLMVLFRVTILEDEG